MVLTPPKTLSPTKVASFTDCALAFRFSAIDRLPEPPSTATAKGTIVHAALQRLFALDPHERTLANAQLMLAEAAALLDTDPELIEANFGPDERTELLASAATLVERYFQLEDPTAVRPIGLELSLEVRVGGVMLRGIIDRLELDEHGDLIVTDYKTGRAPTERYEQSRLGGVHFYALLCERLLGRRPARVQLLYLADPVAIICRPTDRSSRAVEGKVQAIWTAVERACTYDNFRPRPSKLCDYCSFKAYCPAYGGDPDEGRRVAVELKARRARERELARESALELVADAPPIPAVA